ncbi:MAG: hypothetical protein J6L77_10070 [Coprococcus sp.]|nr:hypothetical protein [Coprococcus sp.]
MKATIHDLEYIAKQVVPNIAIKEVFGSPVGVCSRIDEKGQQYIVWDNDFWDFFEKVVFVFDTFPYDELRDDALIRELSYNVLGILFNHLSRRYAYIPRLSATFRKLAKKYHYDVFNHIYPKAKDIIELKEENEFTICICRYLVLYHELGHIVFERDKRYKEDISQNLIENLNAFFNNMISLDDIINDILLSNMCPGYMTKELIKKVFVNLMERKSEKVIEELICDYYAVSKVFETFYLSIEDKKNYTSILSDEIVKAIPIYYIVATSYAYLCSFWDYIVPQFLTLKKADYDVIEKEIRIYSETESLVRNVFFPFFMSIIVYRKEEIVGNYVNLGKRVELSGHKMFNNIDLFSRMLVNTIDDNLMTMVLEQAKLMQQNCDMEDYYYDEISENTLIISWLSNQYHNNLGLNYLKNENYKKALEEFNYTILICERLKNVGHYHRFTARAYNNATSALLSLCEMYSQSPYVESYDITISNILNIAFPNNPNNYIYQAKQYSDIAVDIINKSGSHLDMQYPMIYQNAGAICHSLGFNSEALKNYNRARSAKFKLSKDYSYSHALTDISIAIVYFEERKLEEAEKYCKLAQKFYSENTQKDDINRKKCEELYKQIKEKNSIM